MRQEIKAILKRLHEVKEKVESSLERAQNADPPNEDRIAKLEEEAYAINEAIDALEEIE